MPRKLPAVYEVSDILERLHVAGCVVPSLGGPDLEVPAILDYVEMLFKQPFFQLVNALEASTSHLSQTLGRFNIAHFYGLRLGR
jgi:hypothetical protein